MALAALSDCSTSSHGERIQSESAHPNAPPCRQNALIEENETLCCYNDSVMAVKVSGHSARWPLDVLVRNSEGSCQSVPRGSLLLQSATSRAVTLHFNGTDKLSGELEAQRMWSQRAVHLNSCAKAKYMYSVQSCTVAVLVLRGMSHTRLLIIHHVYA